MIRDNNKVSFVKIIRKKLKFVITVKSFDRKDSIMVVDSVVDTACNTALAALKAPGVTLLTEEQLKQLKSACDLACGAPCDEIACGDSCSSPGESAAQQDRA